MSHWNYRIIRYRDKEGYGLHEVFYGDDGNPTSATVDPVDFACGADEGPDGIISSLRMALKDAIEKPVIDMPGKWINKDGGLR